MRHLLLICFLWHITNASFSQSVDMEKDCITSALQYEINRVYAPLAMSEAKLQSAKTLTDLNPYFKPTWVATYHAVSVEVLYQGEKKQVVGKDSVLTQAQKELMYGADIGEEILVTIDYIPDNTLVDNEAKVFDFRFRIEPEVEATYVGGEEALQAYLQEKVISKIPADSFEGYDLSVIRFSINEEGEVINAHVFGEAYRAAKDKIVDNLLLTSIQNMPCWQAAEYASGKKVKQDFALTVGNHQSCVMHTLNMRRAAK